MKPTQEQVIAWAREAGGDDWGLFREFMFEIQHLVALAYEAGRKDENEACLNCYSPDDTATDWADKMRARREQ